MNFIILQNKIMFDKSHAALIVRNGMVGEKGGHQLRIVSFHRIMKLIKTTLSFNHAIAIVE